MSFLLLEDGSHLLLESGTSDKLLLEDSSSGNGQVLMPQICMSILVLIGGIAAYYLFGDMT